MLQEEQIRVAWEVLERQGWLKNAPAGEH